MNARAELIHQLQCKGANTERAAHEIVDGHAAEVLAADGQTYPGELAMYRQLVRTLRTVVRYGNDLDEVRKLLAEHAGDDASARVRARQEREATA